MRKKDALDLAKLLLENGVDLAIAAVKNGHEVVGKVADTYNFMVELLPVKLPRVPEAWYRAAPPISGASMPVTAERFEPRPAYTPPPPSPPPPKPTPKGSVSTPSAKYSPPSASEGPAPAPPAPAAEDRPKRKRRRRRRKRAPEGATAPQGLPLAKDSTPSASEGPAPAPRKTEPKKAAPKKAAPKKAEPKKVEPKKAAPKKAQPKKAEPKKAAPKKAAPKKAAPKKAPAKRKKKLTPLPPFHTGLVRARREQLIKWCKERGLEAGALDTKNTLIDRLAPLLGS